jgi:uncharacterized membrane protein YkoI
MRTSTKFIVLVTLLGTLGFAGAARLVHAVQPQTEHRNRNQNAQIDRETKDDVKEEAKDGDKETNDDAKDQAKEQQESAKLQHLAKITTQKAQQASESTQSGKVHAVRLENENGNLVYAVEIGDQEVTVDAGNGKVLSTETANSENKAEATNYPRSSIQVSETPGGDGDGETNDDG